MAKKQDVKKDAINLAENTKDELRKATIQNGGHSISELLNTDIQGIFQSAEDEMLLPDNISQYKPVNPLEKINAILNKKKKEVDKKTGEEIWVDEYSSDQKMQMMFNFLAEKSINLIDYMENIIQEDEFSTKLVYAINDTMTKATDNLKSISELQFQKAKLENEREHLRIQKYKADLKLKEIESREKIAEKRLSASDNHGNTNVIAVGSHEELLKLLEEQRHGRDANVVDEDIVDLETDIGEDDIG